VNVLQAMPRIRHILTPRQRRSAVVLLMLMMVGVLLETLGIGVVIPVVALLTQGDLQNTALPPWLLHRIAGIDQRTLIVYAMVGLTLAYLAKNLFLTFLAWRQARFTLDVDVDLSQRLFTTYLHVSFTAQFDGPVP
jgi:ATP-binding cassette, subfamily B, bacterial PglK